MKIDGVELDATPKAGGGLSDYGFAALFGLDALRAAQAAERTPLPVHPAPRPYNSTEYREQLLRDRAQVERATVNWRRP